MRAGRGESDNPVADRDPRSGDQLVVLDYADAKPRQIVVFALVHARHLRGLAADQGAARQFATPADAGNHRCGCVHVESTRGIVVKEEQGLGSGHDEVVHAHGHQVYADGVVNAHIHGQAELGANPVGARYQHWLPVSGRNFAQGAEATQAAEHLGSSGPPGDTLDPLDQPVAGSYIDARIFVAEGGWSALVAHGVGLPLVVARGPAILAANSTQFTPQA